MADAGKDAVRGRRAWAGVLCLLPGLWAPVLDAAQAGKIYRWTDANGQVHYADHPGVPGASELQRDGLFLSVVEGGRRPKAAANPFMNEELRWQQQGREAQRREAEREMTEKLQRCAALRTQLAAANEARARERVKQLERQWFAGCR